MKILSDEAYQELCIGTSSCRREGSQRNMKENKIALIKLCWRNILGEEEMILMWVLVSLSVFYITGTFSKVNLLDYKPVA